jgi:hypothetical protein
MGAGPRVTRPEGLRPYRLGGPLIAESTRSRRPSSQARRILAVGLALVVFLAACSDASDDPDAVAKADQLVAALQASGATIPADSAVALFRTDGGHLCVGATRAEDFVDTVLVSHRFALRKKKVSTTDVAFDRAVISVYCPDELPAFDAFVNGLTTGETSDD